MLDIWRRFDDMGGFARWVDGLENDVDDETGIDLTDDVLPWIGAEFSAAILDIDNEDKEVAAAAAIAVGNHEAAAGFLADWLEHSRDEQGAFFDRDSVNGYDVWVDEDSRQAYALTEGLLVFATTGEALKEVLERVTGEETRTLASNEEFIEARTALPDRRFTSVYVDYRRLSDVTGEVLPLTTGLMGGLYGPGSLLMGPVGDGCDELFGSPDWAMASAAWVDRGIVFDMVLPTVGDLWLTSSDVVDAAELLPEETMGFFSMSFDPDVDHWREALRECRMSDLIPDWEDMLEEINEAIPDLIEANDLSGQAPADDAPRLAGDSTLADALDLGLWALVQVIDVHLEEDLLDYLGGDLFVAVHDVDVAAASSSEPTSNAVDGVAVLSYRPDGEDGLAETLDNLVDRLESLVGQEAERVDVGAENDAHVFDLGGQQFEPGYVIHDGYLTIGNTEESLQTAVARQKGEGDGLSADAEYQRTVGYLPDSRQLLVYIDVQRILDELGRDELGMDDDLYEVLSDGLSAVAMSSGIGEDYSRYTFVLSLLPEE